MEACLNFDCTSFDCTYHLNMLKSALRQITQYEQTQKPTFEAAQAYYNVGKLEECEQVVLELHKNDMVTKAVKRLQQKIDIQKLQISEGKYDYKSMVEEAKENFVVKCQNYVNPNIEIREAGNKRFGYFAKSKIEMGTKLMVEKAFLIADFHQMFKQLQVKVELKDSQLSQYLALKGGDNSLSFDNMNLKLSRNGCKAFPKLEEEFKKDSQKHQVLVLSSCTFNHSCLPNAFWYFIGDVQFIIAQREINENEQIFLSYVDSSVPCEQQPNAIRSLFGFECECQMCQTMTIQDREYISKLKQALENKVNATKSEVTKNDIESVKEICSRIEKVFEESQARRSDLSHYYTELSYVMYKTGEFQTIRGAIDVGIKALECFGIDGAQARQGKLVMNPNKQQFMNYQVLGNTMNILSFCFFAKIQPKNSEIELWLKFLEQVFTNVTGGCTDVKQYLKQRLEGCGVK
ncbi:SET_domain-containing protein [Hexamita inflata]|uniref:SET domain-containing protein n=1 Tax=Hexamita inflata TaxID=28002 RepID=A0AA86V0T2_9EUKA|nr:SET domain-containing protein [Hexamita inflata]